MAALTQAAVENALRGWTEPHLGEDLVTAGAVSGIRVDGGRVEVTLELGFPVERYRRALVEAVREHLRGVGADDVSVEVRWAVSAHQVQAALKPMEGVKNVIAVASAKGGVGKSTSAVNLALALAAEGAKVGLLDADIYGPSLPRMMGIEGQRPQSPDNKSILPLTAHGVAVMSIGVLVKQEEAMVWRGPMVTQALTQLLNDTRWGELDYLVIDLPPGTGDIQLTLAQRVPVAGSVIVTTPQDIATLDARRGIRMFQKVKVPVLGVLENMALHVCSNCGHEEHVFGAGGGQQLADAEGVALLGSMPLDIGIREQTDAGQPTVVADPDGRVAGLYREAALRAAARLSRQAEAGASRFPNIQVDED
ncbi:iron-sulfur cluster carrier protein ApbC [Arhodomonas sp. AD133]|uniref:iron-sulfur cluster carrier protein ApbC n=1 Tax=Arhodomonas sp. AD133 TaxID=3415009 RepID=UPI003EBCDBFB